MMNDHPRRDGVVGRLVDEDERAGGVTALVGIGRDLAAQPQLYVSDVVQTQLPRLRPLERSEVDAPLDGVEPGGNRARAVLERQAVAGARRAVAEPADRGAQ